MSSTDKKNFTKEKKTKKSMVIATIVAGSVITVATIGLVVGVSGAAQAKVDRNVDKVSKPNPDQLNKFDETLNSTSRKVASEKKANKEKYDLAQKVKAEEAKRKQDEAEQAKKKQADEQAAQQQAQQQAAEQQAEQQAAQQQAQQQAAEQQATPQAAQQQANVGYTIPGYSSASSTAIQGIIDSNLTAWVSISDIPTAGGVAVFGHTDFSGRPSAGAWIAGASVGQIVNIGGANYRITSKYTVIHNSDAQYDAVTGAQPGEVIFHTCATLDQGTVWVLRTQRI